MAVSPQRAWETELHRLSELGFALYNERLKGILEPEHNGQTVAIHLESGDYAVAANSPAALRTVRGRQPSGKVMTMTVGPEKPHPALDRILGPPATVEQQ
jgi:hypothetical protein